MSGFVLNAAGQGVSDIPVEVLINGEVVAQLISGETGQFDYSRPDLVNDETWQVRLADFPDAPSLMFDAVEGVRYLVEFEAQPPQETAAAVGTN